MFLKVQSPGPGLYCSPSYVPRTVARVTIGGRGLGRSPVRGCSGLPRTFPRTQLVMARADGPVVLERASPAAPLLSPHPGCPRSLPLSLLPIPRLASLQALGFLNCLPSMTFTSAPLPQVPPASITSWNCFTLKS